MTFCCYHLQAISVMRCYNITILKNKFVKKTIHLVISSVKQLTFLVAQNSDSVKIPPITNCLWSFCKSLWRNNLSFMNKTSNSIFYSFYIEISPVKLVSKLDTYFNFFSKNLIRKFIYIHVMEEKKGLNFTRRNSSSCLPITWLKEHLITYLLAIASSGAPNLLYWVVHQDM